MKWICILPVILASTGLVKAGGSGIQLSGNSATYLNQATYLPLCDDYSVDCCGLPKVCLKPRKDSDRVRKESTKFTGGNATNPCMCVCGKLLGQKALFHDVCAAPLKLDHDCTCQKPCSIGPIPPPGYICKGEEMEIDRDLSCWDGVDASAEVEASFNEGPFKKYASQCHAVKAAIDLGFEPYQVYLNNQ